MVRTLTAARAVLAAVFFLGVPSARAQWAPTSGPTGGPLFELAVTDDAVLATPYGPLFRFDGATWDVADVPVAGRLRASGRTAFVESDSVLLRSTDGGRSFEPVPRPRPDAALLDLDGPHVVLASGDTLFVSPDGGQAWGTVSASVWVTFDAGGGPVALREPLSDVRDVLVEGGTVLAAATAYVFGGVYRLAPSDTSWVPLLQLPAGGLVGTLVRHEGAIFAGSTTGVHRSADGGATWAPASTGLPTALDGAVELYAGAGGLFARAGTGFYRFVGEVWELLPAPPVAPYVTAAVAGDRLYTADLNDVYALGEDHWTPLPSHVATSPLPLGAHGQAALVLANGRLHRTADGGARWEALSPTGVTAAVMDGDLVVAATPGGFFRSTDAGDTWAPSARPSLPTGYLTLTPSALVAMGGTLFAAYGGSSQGDHGEPLSHYGAVFRSTDGGNSWESQTAGLPSSSLGRAPVRSLFALGSDLFAQTDLGCVRSEGAEWEAAACAPGLRPWAVGEAGTRWVALSGEGVFTSPDHGTTWSSVANGLPVPADSPGRSAFWNGARLLHTGDDLLLVAGTDEAVRAYRIDGNAWSPLPLDFPAGVRWVGFAWSGEILYGGAYQRGVWTASPDLSTPIEPGDSPQTIVVAVAPNPTRGGGALTLVSPRSDHARVEAFDSLGRLVALLYDGPLAEGEHRFRLDLGLPAGVYTVRASIGSVVSSAQVTVVR